METSENPVAKISRWARNHALCYNDHRDAALQRMYEKCAGDVFVEVRMMAEDGVRGDELSQTARDMMQNAAHAITEAAADMTVIRDFDAVLQRLWAELDVEVSERYCPAIDGFRGETGTWRVVTSDGENYAGAHLEYVEEPVAVAA